MFGGRQLYAFIGGDTAGAEEILTATGGVIHTWTIPFRCRPIRCGFTITTAVSSTNSVVVEFNTVTGATTGDGDVGTLTILTGAAIGTAYYQETDYVDALTGAWVGVLKEGQLVQVEVETYSSSAGKGIPWLIVEIDPERPANNASMVKTT